MSSSLSPGILVFNSSNFASIRSSKINLLVESKGNAKILNNPAYAVVTVKLVASVDIELMEMDIEIEAPAKSLNQLHSTRFSFGLG